MKQIIKIWLCLLVISKAFGQQHQQENEVKAVIKLFFEGMYKGDSTLIRKTLHPQIIFQGINKKVDSLRQESVKEFLNAVATKPKTEVWDERITHYTVHVDDNLAIAWTPYQFYLNQTFSHCGVNSFQLVKTKDGWKIISIIDTRRKKDCP